jgi:hypothetical protein
MVHGGKVWMGGDSAGVAGHSLLVRTDEKVFTVGEFIFGFTSSFRMGNILHYCFTPPEQTTADYADIMRYMVAKFIPAVRACFATNGYGKVAGTSGDEGGNFLVGFRGQLFNIECDYQVGISTHGFDAVGCGSQIALGSMYATNTLMKGKGENYPHNSLTLALQTAEAFSSGVRGPFVIKSV